jgi:hypothetical protein
MKANDIYKNALNSLGYTDDSVLQKKAVTVINQVCEDLYIAAGLKEYFPISSLASDVDFPEKMMSVLTYGTAEKLALGEGDGELQQYFYQMYKKAKLKLTNFEKVVNTF